MSAAIFKCPSQPTTSKGNQPAAYTCTCKNFNTASSSSCSSLNSDQIPVLFKLNSMKKNMCLPQTPFSTTERLRATPIKKINISCDESQLMERQTGAQRFPANKKCKTEYITKCQASEDEQFYSCCSDDSCSEDEREPKINQGPTERTKLIKTCAILELLNDIGQLINNDDNIRMEAIPSAQMRQPNTSVRECYSKIMKQESELTIKADNKISKLTSTTQLNAPIWPPQPCYYCCSGHFPPYSYFPPYFQPYNLVVPPTDGLKIPTSFSREETDSFKDCLSGNGSIPTACQLPVQMSHLCSSVCDQDLKFLPSPCSSHAQSKCVENDTVVLTDATPSLQCLDLRKAIESQLSFLGEKLKSDFCRETERSTGCLSVNKTTQTAEQSRASLSCICSDLPKPIFTSSKVEFAVELEEYLDEELMPPYVDKIFTEPFGLYEPSPDCLMEYEDEEPILAVFADELDVADLEPLEPGEMYQPCQDCLAEYDDEEPNFTNIITKEETAVESKATAKLLEPTEHVEPEVLEEEFVKSLELDKPDLFSSEQLKESESREEIVKAESKTETESLFIKEEVPTQLESHIKSDQHFEDTTIDELKRNQMPEETSSAKEFHKKEDDNELLGDGEDELAKEKISESLKKKESFDVDQASGKELALRTFPEVKSEDSPKEMKFFIDSLVLDLEAMDHARRKSQFQKNICKPRSCLCPRESFPVTIIDVTELGTCSLYVKWQIHDCCGIGGYEIYTDGHLTNRYYNSRHEAAVITQVDVNLPHKIALMAQPCSNNDSFDYICNPSKTQNKLKSLTWRAESVKERNSLTDLWTPSIFLYDPITCTATAAKSPSLMSNDCKCNGVYKDRNF